MGLTLFVEVKLRIAQYQGAPSNKLTIVGDHLLQESSSRRTLCSNIQCDSMPLYLPNEFGVLDAALLRPMQGRFSNSLAWSR